MMQELAVAVIVACAAWAVLKRYTPRAVRARLGAAVANVARRAELPALAKRLEAPSPAASCADGCGTCGGCSASTGAPPASHGIPLDQLRRTLPRQTLPRS
ncbi:MAG TPA: DUF6587 family protein [Paucimonas sp.]|nr:DUF6587 family protein [Paucimonas sp.]